MPLADSGGGMASTKTKTPQQWNPKPPPVPEFTAPVGGGATTPYAATYAPPRLDPIQFDSGAVADARAQLEAALAPVDEPEGPSLLDQLISGLSGGGSSAGAAAAAADGVLPDKQREDQIASARDAVEAAVRAQRMHAIGADKPEEPGTPERLGARINGMSQQKYDSLSPLQRAGVDWNSMLIDAVRKDTRLADDYKPSPEEKATYSDNLEGLFGSEEAGSTYAPETVALLRQIGFEDSNARLDDFLGLHATIGRKALGKLGGELNTDELGITDEHPVVTERTDFNTYLAQHTQRMEKALAKGNALLQTPSAQQVLQVERNDDVSNMGGTENTPKVKAPGYGESGPQGQAEFFQKGFDTLALKSNLGSADEILAAINSQLGEAERPAFLEYVNTRLTNAQQYGTPVGLGDVDYAKPDELREKLGLGQAQHTGAPRAPGLMFQRTPSGGQ